MYSFTILYCTSITTQDPLMKLMLESNLAPYYLTVISSTIDKHTECKTGIESIVMSGMLLSTSSLFNLNPKKYT